MIGRRSLALAAALAASFAAALPASAKPETFQIDAVHSAVIFRIKHLDASWVYGRFNSFAGSFTVDEENPAASKVSVAIDVASVDTGNKTRDDHLRTPDFFDVAQFPKITFESTAVKKAGDGLYDVTGNLSLHGAVKTVTIRMQKVGTGKNPMDGSILMGFEGTVE